MKRLALALLLLTIVACNRVDDPLRSDPAVYGTVRDVATGEPLDAVHVAVDASPGMTAPNGAYYVPNVARGTHTLRLHKEGYEDFVTVVTVDDELVSAKLTMRRAR